MGSQEKCQRNQSIWALEIEWGWGGCYHYPCTNFAKCSRRQCCQSKLTASAYYQKVCKTYLLFETQIIKPEEMSGSQMTFEDKYISVGSFFLFSWKLVIFASYKVGSFYWLVFVCPLKYSF